MKIKALPVALGVSLLVNGAAISLVVADRVTSTGAVHDQVMSYESGYKTGAYDVQSGTVAAGADNLTAANNCLEDWKRAFVITAGTQPNMPEWLAGCTDAVRGNASLY